MSFNIRIMNTIVHWNNYFVKLGDLYALNDIYNYLF